MNSSLKVGAVSGLVAGIVGAIVSIHYSQWMLSLGLPFWGYPPFTNIVIVASVMNIIWGIGLGILFARVYDLIPGKHVYKGLVYGMILALIFSIRWVTWDLAYSDIATFKADLIGVYWYIIFGFDLGVLYGYLKKYDVAQKELGTSRFDLGNGIRAGAIGGLLGGIGISFAHALFWDPVSFPKYVGNLGFLTAQFGTHAFVNMCWGAVFGILYAKFYDRLPSEGILRGIIFGMIIFFITSFQVAVYATLFNDIGTAISCYNAVVLFFINGLVLGALYKKR